jgi:hypothetical protein
MKALWGLAAFAAILILAPTFAVGGEEAKEMQGIACCSNCPCKGDCDGNCPAGCCKGQGCKGDWSDGCKGQSCKGQGCKGQGFAPTVKIGDKVYTLKTSEKADEDTKKLIASLKDAKKAISVMIKGVIKENTIIADSVTKKT